MTRDIEREEEIFDAARRLATGGERRTFLARECAGDSGMMARIEELLAARQDAERFFADGLTALASIDPAACEAASGDEPLGTRIGRYKLLSKLGEGGWGAVYLAEQEEPFRREVALKIIRVGMETRSVIARFEAERQALAIMDHPNIARVFDAGATERGAPYFVMEWVRGDRITTYCDERSLGVRQRLDLFVQICHAIQHAHQKGIVHGDIKPSNIIVTLNDGAAIPKVIDFGVSRAIDARLADLQVFKAYARLIGTPSYMSPEQLGGSGTPLDTRSDIYSLGVLLYELLAGATPFESEALRQTPFDEIVRKLREEPIVPPAQRLAEMSAGGQESIAARRNTTPERLRSLLGDDLRWIVMKALEKDCGRRYATSNGLASDIQRCLDDEPVVARPHSRIDRFRKLVRRNRGVFAAGFAIAAALIAGLGTSTWLLIKEREARRQAVAAERQQARLRRGAELRERVTQAALLVNQRRYAEADALAASVPVAPSTEAAAVLRSLGEWHALAGRWPEASERLRRMLKADPLDSEDQQTLDQLYLGPVLVEMGDLRDYETFRARAISRFSGTPCPDADRIVKIGLLAAPRPEIVASLQTLVEANRRARTAAEASGDLFQAAWRCVSIALWDYRKGDYPAALADSRRCLAYPQRNGPRVATADVVLAMAARRLGRVPEAEAAIREARALIGRKFDASLDRGNPVQGFWFDWMFARILLREAEGRRPYLTGRRSTSNEYPGDASRNEGPDGVNALSRGTTRSGSSKVFASSRSFA